MITRALCATLLALSALALTPPSTHAQWAPTGERDATPNPTVQEALTFGRNWLGKSNVRPCATHVTMAEYIGTYVDERGHQQTYGGAASGCRVWVLTRYVREANSRHQPSVMNLCITLVHELAHTAGVTHAMMDASNFEFHLFKGCLAWSRRLAAADNARRLAEKRRARTQNQTQK